MDHYHNSKVELLGTVEFPSLDGV